MAIIKMKKKKNEHPAPAPYSPKPDEQAVIEKGFKERKIRPAPAPRLRMEGDKLAVVHPDERVGFLLMENAFGTSDLAFLEGMVNQLARATGAKILEHDLNFMVSFINGIEPRDQVESTLAAQMATVHMAMMKSIQDLPLTKNLLQQDAAERAINKFARTFIAQVEALKRYRSGGEQKVTVQHVSVSEGGQAIVGNVTQNPREAAPDIASSSTPALAHSKVAPMKTLDEAPRKATPGRRKSSK
jgi:hypothetical protein